MRNFCLSIATSFAVAFFCSCESSSSVSGDVIDTYPGIVIFSNASTTNDLALDGLAVMMRFAILQAEMNAAGLRFDLDSDTEPDWSKLEDFDWAGYTNIDKREFLLGAETEVEIRMVEDNSKYTIKFDGENYAGGSLDSNYRRGTYQIETNGMSIYDTSESNPWTLSIYDGEDMALSYSKSASPIAYCSKMELSFWVSDSTEGAYRFVYSSDMRQAGEANAETYSWGSTSTATIKIVDFTSLLIEDSIGKDYEMTVRGRGQTIYGDELRYTVSEPLLYNYSSYPYAKFGGEVECEAYGADEESFPSSIATAEYIGYGYVTVSYNGGSYTY